jgi:peptidylprolyl isomerase
LRRPRRGRLTAWLAAAALTVFAGCDDDGGSATGPETEADGDEPTAADSPLATPDTTASGLIYIPTEIGTGPRPGRGSIVAVHYTGMLEDGEVFDSSYDVGTPFRFALGQGTVIAGWDEGIGLMRQGGKARLVIPAHLAYGDRGVGNGLIPPGATLIFDVWLVAVD